MTPVSFTLHVERTPAAETFPSALQPALEQGTATGFETLLAMLSNDGRSVLAAPFDGTGVLGRLECGAAPRDKSPSLQNPAGPFVGAGVSIPAGAPYPVVSPLDSTDGLVRTAPHRVSTPPQPIADALAGSAPKASVRMPTVAVDTPAPRQSQPEARVHSVQRLTPPRRAAQEAPASLNAIFVALQATEQGLRIVARIANLDPSERVRLRQAIKALLAEHGLVGAEIRLEGPAANEPGGS